MDINTFITKLETLCGCTDMGYMKCLEKVEDLIEEKDLLWEKASKSITEKLQLYSENKKLKEVISDMEDSIAHISNEFMSGDDTLEDIHGYIEQKTDDIVELHEQVEELQKELEEQKKSTEHFCETSQKKSNVITKTLDAIVKTCDIKPNTTAMSMIQSTHAHDELYKIVSYNLTAYKIENEKLKEEISYMEDEYIAPENVNDWINSGGQQLVVDCDDYQEMENTIEELKDKGKSWDILINEIHWDDVRELCDREILKQLIDIGEWDGAPCEIVDYEDDDIDHYIDAGRIAVLKDGREVMSKD